ncbi:MAG: thiol reductant ABC exporter subunit CydC [Gammaproteobacteria bacterium]|nr:thiol reductant ABC exporter subunit CydC [Gammaproteobacteria bacterium]
MSASMNNAQKSHWTTMFRLLRFMRPLNGVMAVSVTARTAKLWGATILVAVAAMSVAKFVANPTSAELWSIAGWLVLGAFGLGLAHYIEQFTGHYVAFRLLAMLRNDFYKRLEPLAPAGMGTLRTGDAISRVINDCERVEPFYAHTIAPAICAIIVPASLLGWLYAINPAFAWTLLPFMLFMIIVLPTLIALIGGSGDADWRRVQGEVNAFLTDSFQGLRDTLAFGAGQRRRDEARRLGEELGRGQEKLTRADAFQRGVTEFVVAAAAVAMLWVGQDLVQAGTVDVLRDLPVVFAIVITSFEAVIGLNNVINDYRVSIVCADRLFELMDQEPAVKDRSKGPAGKLTPALSFDNVQFGYQQGNAILKGISFDLAPGEHVALVGTSGAGKSTIVNLLLRFWDASGGAIRIGGRSITDLPLEELRNLVAVVSQRNYVFNTTIGDNIRMGKLDATQAEIDQAARRANLKTWIDSLPQGYDTPVGEMGSRISGGQRQRLAIARALLKDAPILILDEATSNLDVETEREVNAAIRELQAGRTTLTIAHRLSTVQNADRILVLEQGRVVEQGRHAQLLAKGGVYARIFELQQDEVDALLDTDGAQPA